MRILRVAVLVAFCAPVVLDAQSILVPGELRNGTMKPGEQQTLLFDLDADQSARFELDAELDFSLTLRKPDGTTKLLLNTAVDEFPPLPLTIVAEQSGHHSLELRMPEAATGGAYKLRYGVRGPATDRDRKQAEGESHLREGERLFRSRTRGAYLEALDHYKQATAIFTTLDNQMMLAKSIDFAASAYDKLDNGPLAIQTYERAAGLYRAIGFRTREAVMLQDLGTWLAYQGRAAEAIDPLLKSAERFQEVGPVARHLQSLLLLGSAYYGIGDGEKAAAYYERALPIAKDLKDEKAEAAAYTSLGALAIGKGNLQFVLTYLTRALELNRKLGQRQLEARVLVNIGAAYLRFGDGESALDYLLRAEETSKLEPDRQFDPAILGNIAAAYTMLGQPAMALEFAKKYLGAGREVGNKLIETSALQRIGLVQERLGDFDAAAAAYESVLALSRETRSRQGEGYALNGLARLRLREAAFADAVTAATDALATGRQAGLRTVEKDALVTLARAESASGALDAARDHAKTAIELTESIRSTVVGPDLRSGFVRENYAAYDVLIDVLMRLHRQDPAGGFDRRAFDVSERARARTLLDLIAESRSKIRDDIDPALLSREQALRATLAARRDESDQRVQSLLIQFRELQSEIRAKNPRYAALVEPQVTELATVQRELLGDDTALVEYALGNERSYAWVVDAESFTAHELPPRARIEALARRAHDALSKTQAPDLRARLQELSDAIVTPLGARIAGKRLAIVTEGTLQYIPFAALPGADGRPLIASHEIVSLPSASTLRALRADASPRTDANRSVFVVGDPVFNAKDPRVRRGEAAAAAPATALERSARDSGAADLERLLFTRREADTIASLVPAARARKLLDFDANLDRITSGDLSAYGVLHFATHGLLNNKHPELSGLVFSLVDPQGQPRNGFLPAYEIYNLKMNAGLVVLSACQTALGEDIRGEGLVGLTRAFMYAGTPRVVASLWRVPDSATAALMQRFYRGLLVEKRRPAEALRLAQESVRAEQRWSTPYYWAGFTLAGEWK